MSRFAFALLGGCAVTLIASATLADPPGRVGRISDVEGDVSFLPPGQNDWTYADRNFPVTAGESFWTDDNGRVELQAGALEIRADSDTELDVLALDYGQTRLGLTQGSIDLRLWRAPEGGVTVATPAGDVEIDQAGVYRIDVGAADQDGAYPPVELTVFEGDAGAPGPEGFADVQAGEAALIYAGYDPDIEDAQDAAIDDWARDREQSERWDTQASFAPAMTGYDDLASYGEFVSDPDYGNVWFPSQAPDDWAPYRFGHWAYVNPWGYTWIDDQPWGFAPFHYGRWVQIDGRWGWAPGEPAAQPVYAPALVAFFGIGASIGWTPLAPNEVYYPTYEVSTDYVRRLNGPRLADRVGERPAAGIEHYRNAGAAVVMGADTFSRGARVQGAITRLAPNQLTQATPAAPRAIAPPTIQALSGGAPPAGLERQNRPAPPPSRLLGVRSSLATQPAGSTRPAPIFGERIAPPPARPAGQPVFVAPSQVRNPSLQGRLRFAPRTGPMQPDRSAPAAPSQPATPPNRQTFGQPYARPYVQPGGPQRPGGQSGGRLDERPTTRPMTPQTPPTTAQPFSRPVPPPQAGAPTTGADQSRFGRPPARPEELPPSSRPATTPFRRDPAPSPGVTGEARPPRPYRPLVPSPAKTQKPEDTRPPQ